MAVDILGPLPWKEGDLRKLYFRDFLLARERIEQHPGFRVHEDLQTLKLSLGIFRLLVADLLELVESFRSEAQAAEFWLPKNRGPFNRKALAVTKTLFAAAASAAALIDHSRRIQETYQIQQYELQRKRIFDEGENRFITSLRNYVSHIEIAEARWRREYTKQGRQLRFLLTPGVVRRWNGWTSEAKDFINRHPEGIDVEVLLRTYQRKVEKFQAWFRTQIEKQCKDNLKDYRRYDRMLRRFDLQALRAVLRQ